MLPPEEKIAVITDVQIQRRRAERRSIFIDGEFAFGVSEETYVRYALYKGREVSVEFISEVLQFDTLYRCRQSAMRFLSRRMRSRQEVERKLIEKEFEPEVIAATMTFLEEYNLIDDSEFARAYVNDQLLRRPVGRRRLEQELKSKGIDKEEITEVVSRAVDEENELANAMEAAAKKARTLKADEHRKWERSLAAFLAGRGFGWDAVGKVLEHYRMLRRDKEEESRIESQEEI